MNTYQFGTLAGHWTAAELKELIAAKDATMRNLAREFNEVKGLPLDFTDFLPAYQNLVNRYLAARKTAQAAVDDAANAWRPANMIIADAEFKELLSSLNPRWQEYTWSPGDGSVEDLYDRLRSFGATGKGAEPIPQPSQAADVDISVYQQTSQAQKEMESALHWFDKKHLMTYAIVGGALALLLLPRLMAVTPIGIAARSMR